MTRGSYQNYLAIVVVLVGTLIGGSFVVHAHLEELLPCSLVRIDGIPLAQMTKKEKDCSALRASQEHEQELEAGKQAEKDSLNWPEYGDDKLGIAIRHPETSDGDSIVFFHAGNILLVRTTKSSLYARRAELPTENDANILTKAKQIAASSSDSTGYDGTWEIRV